MANLVIHSRAAGYIQKLDGRIKTQLRAKLTALANNPDAMAGVKPMAGEWAGFHRLRHGDLRIIFWFDRRKDTVVIAHVGPRGDVYK